MRRNLMMVPQLTLIIHPSINTHGYVSSGNNCFVFAFDRSRLIKFFKDLISMNNHLHVCYSFNVPPEKNKNRLLANEVPISFACLLSFAEAAAYKNVPIYFYPLGTNSLSVLEEPGKPLNFHDFENIFNRKLDLKSALEIRKNIQVIGPVTDVSYPSDVKTKKNDGKKLNLAGHLSVRPVSSEAVADLLAKGSNVVLPNGDNGYLSITLAPQSNWCSRDDFGVSWKTQNDNSASCGAIRVPIVVKSNQMFYSKRGTNFMTVFKTELEESSQKNKSSVSSNPFHNDVKEKPADEVQSDSEYHDVSNAQNEFPETVTEDQTTKTADVSSKSAPQNESSEEAPKSDEDEPLSARQLSSFLNQFKDEMKEQIVGMVEETVKKYSGKDRAEGASGSKKEAEKRSVINVTDCVKSEADDSDLPKLLSTLSQIEEQLSCIENADNSDMASTKPHGYMHSYGFHGHHRRGRDFSSVAKRATLSILKKRVKGSVVELESNLFAISKAGFKLKMSRNVSQSFRFVLFKSGKYRNSKFEVDFTPTIVPNGGIECCVKPAVMVELTMKGQEKSQIDDKGLYSIYDVRFKSKERTGKFRCYLKILRNGKVCGHPLCITVRVKRFNANSDQVDSAEEALPCYSGPRGNGFGGFEPTSSANVDVDEGISVFQEYPSSASSDSEDGEAPTRENDNDEGIDTKLDVPCSAFEKLSINEKRMFSVSDEDSDSSVSLLLDENEVREIVDKEFDSVKIPPCFIPNADMTKEPMSIRVKRKLNSTRKKKLDTPTAAPPKNPTKKKDWWELVLCEQAKNTAINSATEPKSTGNSASKPETAAKGAYEPLYPILDDRFEAAEKACRFEAADKASNPATTSFTTQSPVAILPEKVFEMTSNVFKSVMNSMKQPTDVKENMQKNIDETLWSISRSVFGASSPSSKPSEQPGAAPPAASSAAASPPCAPAPTFSAAPSAPAEPPVMATTAAPAPNPQVNQPQPEQQSWPTCAFQVPKATSSAAQPGPSTDVPIFAFPDPRFAPPPPFAPPTNRFAFNIPPPPQSTTIGTNTPNVASTSNASSFYDFSDFLGAPANIGLGPVEQTKFEGYANTQMPGSATANVPEPKAAAPPTEKPTSVHTPASPRQTPPKPKRSDLIDGEEYNRLEPDVRQKILQLNEMGFSNDSYNLFLIRKYPQDMDKVVESLVNYNDF